MAEQAMDRIQRQLLSDQEKERNKRVGASGARAQTVQKQVSEEVLAGISAGNINVSETGAYG